MQKKQIILVLLLLVVLVAGMFWFAYISRSKMATHAPTSTSSGEEEMNFDVTSITAKHFYSDERGIHTLAGEIPMPTPCDLITTNVVLLENTSRALVSFDVINNSGGQCEQKVTGQRFKVGFQAPKDIKIEAVFKGNPVTLNLIPAGEGESPADFELQVKG